MFITVEDEIGVANLVVWPKMYEKHRRTILTASMLGIDGRIQREGDEVHLIAWKLFDLSELLASVGGQDTPFPLPHRRGDEFARGPSSPDPGTVARRAWRLATSTSLTCTSTRSSSPETSAAVISTLRASADRSRMLSRPRRRSPG